MSKNQSTKVQTMKKEKGKEKPKEKEKNKDKKEKDKKEKEKDTKETDSEEYFTEEEIKLLDKFHIIGEHKFDDDEIYEVMLKFNNNEQLIENEIKEMLKELKRGDEFNWTQIGKSN